MVAKQALVLTAARTLLDHHRVGRFCDPDSLKWAQSIVAAHEKRESK